MDKTIIKEIVNQYRGGKTELATGYCLYNFLTGIDIGKSSIGAIRQGSKLGKGASYLVVTGTEFTDVGSSVDILRPINISINIGRKFKTKTGKSGARLLADYCKQYKINSSGVQEILKGIEENQLVIVPIKPRMNCKVYVESIDKVEKKQAEVIPFDENTKKMIESIENNETMREEMLENDISSDLDNEVEKACRLVNNGSTGYKGNTRTKCCICSTVPKDSDKTVERTSEVSCVRYEIDRETGNLKCYILTEKIGANNKRARVSIEQYGISLFLSEIDKYATCGDWERQLVRFDSLGYIHPVEINFGATRIIVDGTFMYEVINGVTHIVGQWDSSDEMQVLDDLNIKQKKRLKDNERLQSGLKFIAQHRRFIAPYGLVESISVDGQNKE